MRTKDSKDVWNLLVGIMKNQLKLAEFGFGSRDTDRYKYYKEQTMNHFYEAAKKYFLTKVADGSCERCPCGANLRHGWDKCEDCAGSGYRDKE